MRKLSSSSELFHWITPIFLVVSLFLTYLFTMAPDLNWAHDAADGGDLITAAATGGVAHPSGYPTFLWLARLFQLLPLGTIAYRTNLMLAVFTALTALLVYDIVVSSPNSPAKDNRLAGLIAGYAYGLSPLAWAQAVITEVYGLHIFFVALILWLLVGRFAYSPNKPLHDVAIGLSMGLAMGNHLTSAALLPVALLASIVPPPSSESKGKKVSKRKKDERTPIDWAAIDWLSLGRRLGSVLVVGLLVYASILWRASTKAPINWNYADNLNNLWMLVSGALYQRLAFSLPLGEALLRLISVAQLLLTQFGILGLLAGIYHLFGNFSLSRPSLVLGWVAVTNTIFSLGYSSTDSFLYLLPLFLVFAIWIGFGVGNLNRLLAQQKSWLRPGVSIILLASFLGMAVMNYPKLDLSRDRQTQKFTKAVFAALPPEAIVIAKGDRSLFSLWYYHFVIKERQDIAVLSRGLLRNAWYIDVIHDTYSTLNISLKDVASDASMQAKPIPIGLDTVDSQAEAEAVLSNSIAQDNPMRPVCDVTIIYEQRSPVGQMSIVCYSPASQKSDTPFISILEPIDE